MIYKKICAYCGKMFASNRELTLYCGADCRKSARKKYQYEWNKQKRARISQQRERNRSELSASRSAEIEERSKRSKEDFERRCREGDPHALLIREKMLRGNSSARYWELFAQCEIEEAERAGNISRLAVNGISVYERDFAGAVLESIESQGYIVMELGRSRK